MSNYLIEFSQHFWSEKLWLPKNRTWQSLEANNYRHFNDIYYSVITALVLIGIRLTLEKFIYEPIGLYFGLKPTHGKSLPNNAILEKAFGVSKGKINGKQIEGLAKQLDCSQRQVERWIRRKKAQNRQSVLSKFKESAWRCSYYSVAFIYGCYMMWDKPWMWDSMYCFIDYPDHIVSSGEWFYYNFETAFCLTLLFSQFFDLNRKDISVMFVHHVVTLCLLVITWASNMVRMGTYVLLIHDLGDIALQSAKMMTYMKKQRLANGLFVLFTIYWVVFRIGLYPYRILYYTSYLGQSVVPMFAYYLFNSLLFTLQALHIVWTWFIVKSAIHALKNNEIKDLRSGDEGSTEESQN